jgi:hypothetical protein
MNGSHLLALAITALIVIGLVAYRLLWLLPERRVPLASAVYLFSRSLGGTGF